MTSPFPDSAPLWASSSWPPASSNSRSGKDKARSIPMAGFSVFSLRSLIFLIIFKSTKGFVNCRNILPNQPRIF
ncbi:unnamed protein product [Brassica napus]|uniref:(rape) hypothetical protein n=1 Tax=Brassica napus TaxID=3708 RepID=A0A816PBL5_BRANA|nr:unnamed protein product [Brassica napus]